MLWRSFGAIIKKAKEVEADDSSECIWKYAKVRISVDITKPLQRIIFLKHTGLCFCCGKLSHQFREYLKYERQLKKDFTFCPWLKAITLPDRFKQKRNQERWNLDKIIREGEFVSQEHHKHPQDQ